MYVDIDYVLSSDAMHNEWMQQDYRDVFTIDHINVTTI